MVAEGLADHFDLELSGRNPQAWDTALTVEQLETYRVKVREEHWREDYDHFAWFFGTKPERIPKWAGYTLGFQIVGEYLSKNPGRKPSDLYASPAQDFLVSENS